MLGGGTRLALFALALALVAGAAALLGRASDVVVEPTPAAEGHGGEEEEGVPPANGLSDVGGGIRFLLEPATLEPGGTTRLSLQLLDEDGEPVTELDEHEDEPPLHLILVRRDLSRYVHLHPTVAGDGFVADVALPESGLWRAYADFELDGEKIVLGRDLVVPGVYEPRRLPPSVAVARDGASSATLAHDELRAETEATLTFELGHGGEPVEPQPYLGADGHLVAIREDDLAYLHVHPVEEESGGSTIAFDAEFADAGRYVLFLQFKHGGRVRTVDFVVEVER